MSTRTNIQIIYGDSIVWLYRHHDGYPEITGADLEETLEAVEGDAEKFLTALLSKRYEQQPYETKPRAIYELTTGKHGDIEYLYIIAWRRDGTGQSRVPSITIHRR